MSNGLTLSPPSIDLTTFKGDQPVAKPKSLEQRLLEQSARFLMGGAYSPMAAKMQAIQIRVEYLKRDLDNQQALANFWIPLINSYEDLKQTLQSSTADEVPLSADQEKYLLVAVAEARSRGISIPSEIQKLLNAQGLSKTDRLKGVQFVVDSANWVLPEGMTRDALTSATERTARAISDEMGRMASATTN